MSAGRCANDLGNRANCVEELAAAAQTASKNSLPPLNVEANKAKKKIATPQSSPASNAAPAAVAEATPEQKTASPYVDPVAPYKVDESGSGKIIEPLADTAKTITAVSKEVLEDKAVTSVRELARQTPGVVLGFADIQLPTYLIAPISWPSSISVSRERPRQMTRLPGGGSLDLAR